jgi:hypothetical protein
MSFRFHCLVWLAGIVSSVNPRGSVEMSNGVTPGTAPLNSRFTETWYVPGRKLNRVAIWDDGFIDFED